MSEDDALQMNIALQKKKIIEECSPPPWLTDAESPFKWLLSLENILVRGCIPVKKHLPPSNNEDPDFECNVGLRDFCSLLGFVALKSLGWKEISSGFLRIDNSGLIEEEGLDEFDSETLYSKCEDALDNLAAVEGEAVYSRIGPAMQHILQATKAHMLFLKGNIAESKDIAEGLQPVVEMSHECQAGIHGIKGNCIMNVYKDSKGALKCFQKAMKKDPDFPKWAVLTGLALRDLRIMYEKEANCKEEIECFEKALNIERSVHHIIFLARAHQECRMFLEKLWYPKDKDKHIIIEDICCSYDTAVDLFREGWSLQNDKQSICRRIGNGLTKIPKEHTDLNLAKEALKKAVDLSPNENNLSALGRFYYRIEQDDEKALECFERARGFYGIGEIIKINLIRDPDYDPYELIQELAEGVNIMKQEDKILCDIGWYYLVFKTDLEESTKYFWRVLSNDLNSPIVRNFRSYAFCVRERHHTVCMIKILVNEIMLLKEKDLHSPPQSKKSTAFLEYFLEKMLEHHPHLGRMKPDSFKLRRLLEANANCIRSERNKRYGSSGNCGTLTASSCSNNKQETWPYFSGCGNSRSERNYRMFMGNSDREGENRSRGERKEMKFNRNRDNETIKNWRKEPRIEPRMKQH